MIGVFLLVTYYVRFHQEITQKNMRKTKESRKGCECCELTTPPHPAAQSTRGWIVQELSVAWPKDGSDPITVLDQLPSGYLT